METKEEIDVTFTKQDDEAVKEKVDDTYKYTKIDTLDEDPPFEPENGTCYVAISFVSPEGLMNCHVRGFKVRGFFFAKSDEEAKKRGQELNKKLKIKDKYFDIFVAPVGKWCPWDPDPLDKKYVHETEYDNKKLDKMMKSINERNMNDLNELVGRRKDQINKGKDAHKQRIADTMKDNAKSKIDEEDTNNENQKEKIKKHDHNDTSEIKARLRKKLEQKQLEKTTEELRNSKPVEPKIEEIKTEKTEHIDKTRENIDRMKGLLNRYQSNKQ